MNSGTLCSIQKGQKTPYNIPDIRFGYFDYFNERVQTSAFSVYSFDIFPMWFAEGIAQYESSTHGSDTWDSHRDMIMRMKAHSGKFLPMEQMDFFIGKGMDYESGPYNQGFSMVRFIEATYGPGAIEKICHSCQKPLLLSFDMALQDAIGVSKSELYSAWAKAEKEKYASQVSKLGSVVEGHRIMRDSSVVMGYRNLYPQWGPGDSKLFFLSNGSNPGGRAPLSVYDFCDTIKEEKDRYKPIYPGINGFFSLSDSGKKVTSSSPSANPFTGESYTEAVTDSIPGDKFLDGLKLGFCPDKIEDGNRVSKIRKQLTYRDHIMQACLNHKGDRLAAVRKVKNRYSLVLMEAGNTVSDPVINTALRILLDVEFPKKIRKNDEKELFQPEPESKEGFLIYNPRFSPNDSLVVFSYFNGNTQDIGVVDTAGHFTELISTPADERDPAFSPDGKYVIFSSDNSGIFNLYRMELETRKIERMTNVAGGAFCPAVSNDNKRIAYSNFDSSGFSIYLMDNNPIVDTSSYPVVKKAEIKHDVSELNFATSSEYFPSLKRLIFSPMILGEELTSKSFNATSGKMGIKAGGLLWLTDPLEKNSLMIMGLMEVDKWPWIGTSYGRHLFFNPKLDKDMMVLFENKSFTPTFSFEVDKFLIHRNDSFYNVAKDVYESNNYVIDVQNYSFTTRFQLLSPFRKLHFGLNYSRQNVDFYELDPNFTLEYPMFKEYNPTIYYTYLKLSGEGSPWREEDNIDTRGTYLKFKYDYLHDSIMVDGSSFQESFEINNSGVLHPKYRFDSHNRLKLDFRHAKAAPFLPLVTLGGEVMASVADKPIDNYVYPGLFMKSYPFLTDEAHLGFLGRNVARAELYTRFPIFRHIRQGAGIFLVDKIYGMAFIEGGVAAGIDPSEEGRSDLDQYSRDGRTVGHYMARLPVNADNNRQRISAPTEMAMQDTINKYSAGSQFDSRDKHTVYSSLPEDTMTGFAQNFKMLFNAPLRLGFGFELRFENYIVPGYPFFMTLRYSHTLLQDDPGLSFRNYFTKDPFNSKDATIYLNVGFSFDNWDLIDIPAAHHLSKQASRF